MNIAYGTQVHPRYMYIASVSPPVFHNCRAPECEATNLAECVLGGVWPQLLSLFRNAIKIVMRASGKKDWCENGNEDRQP